MTSLWYTNVGSIYVYIYIYNHCIIRWPVVFIHIIICSFSAKSHIALMVSMASMASDQGGWDDPPPLLPSDEVIDVPPTVYVPLKIEMLSGEVIDGPITVWDSCTVAQLKVLLKTFLHVRRRHIRLFPVDSEVLLADSVLIAHVCGRDQTSWKLRLVVVAIECGGGCGKTALPQGTANSAGHRPDHRWYQCQKCMTVNYCSRQCQKGDWKRHRDSGDCVPHSAAFSSAKIFVENMAIE